MFHKLFRLALVITLVFSWPVIPVTASPHVGLTWYVKPDGSGDCSDWSHACELQTALAAQPWPMRSGWLPASMRLALPAVTPSGWPRMWPSMVVSMAAKRPATRATRLPT